MQLYYFTQSFPYGVMQQWKISELDALKKYFKEITIVPHEFHLDGKKAIDNYEGIPVTVPLFTQQVYLSLSKLGHLFSPRFFIYLKEFLSQQVFLSKKRMTAFFMATYKIEKMLSHPAIKKILQDPHKEETALYFYWGVGTAFIAPFFQGYKNVSVRFHGYDLYKERNSGYIPFRKRLLKNIDHIILISEHGKRYLESHYPQARGKCHVFRLGTRSVGDALASDDGVLRIISCSSLKSLKRVPLILQAIKKLSIPICWTHFGDGEMMEELQEASKALPANVQVFLKGHIHSDALLYEYAGKKIDLFLNVSTTEGVPVSVMEAFSASIPVMATDVGGTGEIVNESVGKLIPVALDAALLANYIKEFYDLTALEKQALRIHARQQYQRLCDETILNDSFAKFLYAN